MTPCLSCDAPVARLVCDACGSPVPMAGAGEDCPPDCAACKAAKEHARRLREMRALEGSR